MARIRFGHKRKARPLPAGAGGGSFSGSAKEAAQRLKAQAAVGRNATDYRRRSLEIHGWICAKCAREFDETNLHLLTVHHRDGNPRNNPPDGSNWENLCAFCHDDEHSRDRLGRYLSGEE